MDGDLIVHKLDDIGGQLVAARAEERRRLERDLHDGAQQGLIVLRMKLGLARTLVPDTAPELRALLAEIEDEMGEALESIRGVVSGFSGQVLETRGLYAALAALARRASLPIELDCAGLRYTVDVERCVYFSCAEAVQNVLKHAGATRASVRVWPAQGWVNFEVSDDGRGFDPTGPPRGQGLPNVRERLRALGGDVDLWSRPGLGTRLAGRVPLAATADVPEREVALAL
jgi:signal transduction histidine kinase